MSIFDPLGLLGFFVIRAKIILQNIWRSGVNWDEPIKDAEYEQWLQWVDQIPSIRSITIPRCIRNLGNSDKVDIHTFIDASIHAYAAACYMRVIRKGAVCCSLVMSKTRVTPLKPISVPRLELMACVLGLRLAKFVEAELSTPINKRCFWTDSKNVLYWISSDARKFHQFVALRIGEILENSKINEWRWVPTAINVADYGTKWRTDTDISLHSRWFNGPEFLSRDESHWPITQMEGYLNLESEVICHVEVNAEVVSNPKGATPDVEKFSKWEKLLNCQKYILKFIQLTTKRICVSSKLRTLLSMKNLAGAENVIIRSCQQEEFRDDVKSLVTPPHLVNSKSLLLKYCPYIDDHGLLRSRGRIDALDKVPTSVKRPIILPRKHKTTWLIIDFYHRRYHHHHNEIIVNEVRQRYVISGLRALVNKVVRNCQACKNKRAVPIPPIMGDLPQERVAAFTLPFTFTGIDYFGPINIVIGRRKEKRWGVVFSCLTTMAIHLEVAPSLSTDSFLLAFKQFVSRRGVPKRIVSDNATNFRGASRILIEQIERISSTEIEKAYPEIEWRFIPPSAPHMGGAWERMIRSVKSILMDILPETGLREEVLRAALADVENILNSRPLTYVPLDSPTSEAITPNHLLLGSSSGIRELSSQDDSGMALRRNFHRSSQLADQFWRRWLREYLPYLTRRTKWLQAPADPIRLQDVVLIVDENAKRNTWKRGIVMDLHYSKERIARSAVVRTADGLITRPVVKLAKLDVRGNSKHRENHDAYEGGNIESFNI